MRQIEDLFKPVTPVFKQLPSVYSVLMAVFSGSGCAIADEWSMAQFYDNDFYSMRLPSAEVPVVFARHDKEDPYIDQLSAYLQNKLQLWIKETPGIFK